MLWEQSRSLTPTTRRFTGEHSTLPTHAPPNVNLNPQTLALTLTCYEMNNPRHFFFRTECVDGAPTDVHTHPAVQRATRLASVMLGAGWINCLDSYASLRGAAIDEAFVSVGAIGSMTAASLQMQSPEQLERIVGRWGSQFPSDHQVNHL